MILNKYEKEKDKKKKEKLYNLLKRNNKKLTKNGLTLSKDKNKKNKKKLLETTIVNRDKEAPKKDKKKSKLSQTKIFPINHKNLS